MNSEENRMYSGTGAEANSTSPGQLQDVTMDNSYAIGYRSPCVSLQQHTGPPSPGQGRTVREFEEQMASLRKDNFNLKLRIYFLEEKLPGYSQMNTPEGQESLMKQYIDAKVEIEVLRKDMQEKQDLLVEAAQALTKMEKLQKDTEKRNTEIAEEFNQKIQYLEAESREFEKTGNGQFMDQLMGRTDVSGDFSAIQRIRELEGTVKESKDQIDELSAQINKMDETIFQRDNTIKEFEDKLKELVFQNAELLEQLENKEKEVVSAESQQLREELLDYKRKLADFMCALEETEGKLRAKTNENEKTYCVVEKLVRNNTKLQNQIERLKGTTNNETLMRSLSDTEGLGEASALRTRYDSIIANKDNEIAKLQLEVKKKTANLQNLVNKELWEKNREIERLTKVLNKSASLSSNSLNESNQLKKSFTDSEYVLAVDRNKHLQTKVDTLIKRLGATPTESSIVEQLKQEIREAKEETAKAETWRKECSDVCSMLTLRLEELAGFLDSLLKHKEILVALGADRRHAMRKAVDKSLDLSRSINNMSLSTTGRPSVMDQSLAQLSNISGLFDFSIYNENKTCNSHDETQPEKKIVETLQAEVIALKKELDKRKSSDFGKKERRTLSLGIENLSESEAWSEPDRKVSMARIGLEEPLSVKSGSIKKDNNASTSEDSLELSRSKSKAQDKINQLEQMISQRDNRILEVQCELVDADNRLMKENLRMIEITRELEGCRKLNDQLQTQIARSKSESDNLDENKMRCEYLKTQIDEKSEFIQKIQEERDKINIEARVAEIQIETLKTDIEQLKHKHEIVMKQASEQEQIKLDNMQKELQANLELQLKAQEEKHNETIFRDWIARTVFDEFKAEYDQLQKKLKESQSTVDFLTENEAEMKSHLIENEKAMRALKKNLDDATLQASKTVLERTKALNDKLQLERKVQELEEQINLLETEKQQFYERITELENSNAMLQDKVLNISSGQYKSTKSSNGSDASHSGYTSEDVPLGSGGAEAQRLENSSPDLGIESDGRVSSVELASAQIDLLKIAEISQSKLCQESKDELESILNDIDQQDSCDDVKTSFQTPQKSASNTRIAHDCAKVDQEIVELRRKLIRNKTSFEKIINKLRIDNQRKEKVEREIKNQILKTHNVLKNVRSNIENELK